MLVDLEMPVMNGYEFINHVKRSAVWREIPVIVLTGNTSEVTHTLTIGACDFISKPFNCDELQLRVMRQARNKKEADLAKKTLQKSEARSEQLLQSTDQGIYSVNMEGCCTFINKPGLNILGFQAEDCIGKNMHNLIHHTHPDGSPYPVEPAAGDIDASA